MSRYLTLAAITATALASVALSWSWAQSAPNPGARTIPYQGFLEINGQATTPVTPPSMIFTLTDGANTWQECYASVPVSAGRFSVEIGSYPGDCGTCAATSCSDGGGVPAWAFAAGDLRLRLTVNGVALDNEQRIQPVPYAVRADTVVETGTVGDVAYSMLTEAQFQSLRGPGWILAAGQLVTESEYATITGETNVPDMRGEFLRSADNGRGIDPGRAAGSPQSGATAPNGLSLGPVGNHQHLHGTPMVNGDLDNYNQFGWANAGQGAHIAVNSSPQVHDKTPFTNGAGGHEHAVSGDGETRPRNVAVNTFIRIN